MDDLDLVYKTRPFAKDVTKTRGVRSGRKMRAEECSTKMMSEKGITTLWDKGERTISSRSGYTWYCLDAACHTNRTSAILRTRNERNRHMPACARPCATRNACIEAKTAANMERNRNAPTKKLAPHSPADAYKRPPSLSARCSWVHSMSSALQWSRPGSVIETGNTCASGKSISPLKKELRRLDDALSCESRRAFGAGRDNMSEL
mmetsp:Transcript_45755/g.74649  ORF Transcript_45755/g.74649 Transcript_45755/m.74649 type:complete len:205 (-) Transcript_45755:461-1075(-)